VVGFVLHIIPPDFLTVVVVEMIHKIRQAVIHVKVDKDNLIEACIAKIENQTKFCCM